MADKNNITLLHSLTPEELTNIIFSCFDNKLGQLKKELIPNNKETYLTRIETSEMLSISLTCLNDWCKKGILIPLKLGNRTYFKLSDIENKLNNSNSKN